MIVTIEDSSFAFLLVFAVYHIFLGCATPVVWRIYKAHTTIIHMSASIWQRHNHPSAWSSSMRKWNGPADRCGGALFLLSCYSEFCEYRVSSCNKKPWLEQSDQGFLLCLNLALWSASCGLARERRVELVVRRMASQSVCMHGCGNPGRP